MHKDRGAWVPYDRGLRRAYEGMAVFRVEKSNGYTVMCNYHLRDRNLSCKACGLLSKMLSLPDEWDYTTRGLAAICKDGVDSITTALKELEACGYLVRTRRRDDRGRVTDTEYVIYERPRDMSGSEEETVSYAPFCNGPDPASPDPDFPYQDFPEQEFPDTEIPAEINKEKTSTKETNTKKSITDSLSYVSFSPSVNACDDGENALMDDPVENFREKGTDRRTELSAERVREEIRKQIDYNMLLDRVNPVQLTELVEIMTEVSMNRSPTIRLSRDEEYPAAYVRERFRKITSEHIEKVFECIRENAGSVKNVKAYLLAALFNVVSTLDHHYAMMAAADISGSG